MRNLIPVILALAMAPLGACRGIYLGVWVDTVDREYARPASVVCDAALQCARSAEFNPLINRRDPSGGELRASRADGKEIHIVVKTLGVMSSRVSVRVEPGDRELANLMHERIAGILGMANDGSGRGSGGNSLDATNPADPR